MIRIASVTTILDSVLGLYPQSCFHAYTLDLICLVGIWGSRCLKPHPYTFDHIHHKTLGYDCDKHQQECNHLVLHYIGNNVVHLKMPGL
jgi:hypothetical protein